jgi:hypothetical protein
MYATSTNAAVSQWTVDMNLEYRGAAGVGEASVTADCP